MSHIVLNDDNFQDEVLNYKGVTLVDMWATWCMPCVMLGPVIEEISEEMKDKIKVGKLDVDQNQKIAMKYNVMSIPTVLLIKDGEIVETFIGVQPKQVYIDAINKYTS